MKYKSVRIYKNHWEVVSFNTLTFDKMVIKKMLVYSIFTIGA